MLKLAPILKEISKDFRMGGHDGSGGHDGKLHQAFTLVMEWEAVEYLKVSRWDQKSQITTVESKKYKQESTTAQWRIADVGVAAPTYLPAGLQKSPVVGSLLPREVRTH